MTWKPISETEIWDKLNSARERMSVRQERLWDAIKTEPEKWNQTPYGTDGGGFWVVGIMGRKIVWYNDIEDGFNCSNYTRFWVIEDYWCNQDELEDVVQYLLILIEDGHDAGPFCGPPIYKAETG